ALRPVLAGHRHLAQLAALGGVGEIGVGAGLIADVAPEEQGLGPAARRILELGFAEQPIGMAGLAAEPGGVGLGVVPAHADHRMVIGLRNARIAPGIAGGLLIDRVPVDPVLGVAGVLRRVAGLLNEGAEL